MVKRKIDLVTRRLRRCGQGRKLWAQREVERARQCIRPSVRELIKRLERDPNIERTKDGRIKVRSLPLEVRKKFKEEALRLRKMGWGSVIVVRALDIPLGTVNNWFHPF